MPLRPYDGPELRITAIVPETIAIVPETIAIEITRAWACRAIVAAGRITADVAAMVAALLELMAL